MSPARSIDQLRQHYEVERELADRLRNASKEKRTVMYGAVYDELFRRVPLHPQLTRKADNERTHTIVEEKLRLLRGFLKPTTIFLEIGAGDCALSVAVATGVRNVYALDVSVAVTSGTGKPDNFSLIISEGTNIPLPAESITVAYSYQLTEHLHPDDAEEQLLNLYHVMAAGGAYICVTPNRLTGPHDISRYFSTAATGFHLREYTLSEAASLLRRAGFSKVSVRVGTHGWFVNVPLAPIRLLEHVIGMFSHRQRLTIGNAPGLRHILQGAVIGYKRS